MAALCSGCLTALVVDRSAGRTPWYAHITQVKQATTLGTDLFLQLGVQSEKYPETRTVVLRVPFADIGMPRESDSAGPLEVDNLRFQPPSVGYWVSDGVIPEGSSPVQVEYLDAGSYEAVDQHLASLEPGMHVLIALNLHTYHQRVADPPLLHDGEVPTGAHVILANRIEGYEPDESYLWSFNEARRKNRAWLLLTPLTVVGDILTSPIQLIYIVGD